MGEDLQSLSASLKAAEQHPDVFQDQKASSYAGKEVLTGKRDTEKHRQEQGEKVGALPVGLRAKAAVWLVVVAEPRNPTPTSITTRASRRGKQPDGEEVSANNLMVRPSGLPTRVRLEQKNVMAPFSSSPRFPSRIFLSVYRLPVCPHAASVSTPYTRKYPDSP